MRPTTILASFLLLASYCVAAERAASDGELPSRERLDRGVVARPAAAGKVYIGWRLLASDADDVEFNVYRQQFGEAPLKLNTEPIRQTTDFTDPSPPKDARCVWTVRTVADGKEGPSCASPPLRLADQQPPYISIKLQGDYTFQKVGIADLDGDGRYDYVIKQPNANVDPYSAPGYWSRSPGTYKLEAYRHDGKFLWRLDLGWSIEQGIWYSPYVVYDLDGDGKAEVALKTGEGDPRDSEGRVRTGPEHLTILEGLSGKPITRVDWPSRDGFREAVSDDLAAYNYYCRNQLCVAYLDGKTPSLLVERGTYNLMKLVAYQLRDGQLRELWRWDNSKEPRKYWGQGAHWMHAADVDGDGRDEVLLGSSVIDDDGKALWSTGLGHPDHCYVGEIDPERPGLEIYYGMETPQKERNGMCLVDAATGKILWGHEGSTRHVHSRGMCSDIDARYPGCECYSADTDASKRYAWSRLRTCKGEVLSEENLGGFGALVVHWDADLQRELLLGRNIQDYHGGRHGPRIEGNVAAVADVLGDWREELLTSVPGELRIYTTTIPATDRRVCLMQDPIYRMDVVCAAMGYFQVPMTSYDLAKRKR
jgi:rhamnogalacturonan endolyase